MPLTMAKAGEKNLIKRITGKDEVRRFLATLGFVEGETVTVISEISGNMILNIKDTRVALDKTMANRIMI
ncbi:FeoA family protein [Clostridium minihomine]|uniref:FeoA family protein n=1 Tax=Clostridium minihomine TaxID=2045012 RepID=UPI000C775EA6|nr:FeoA family protein [Clostridium minihomine]